MIKQIKIAQWIREWIRYVRLHGRTRLLPGVTPPAAENKEASGIIVSMTTIPGRINKIFPAINSLMDQALKPDRIYLSVPSHSRRENRTYIVPEGLLNHPLVKVVPADRDWGPATKLIPVLMNKETTPDGMILAVDDDNIYPHAFLSTFRHYARILPHAALSLRGWHIPASRRWKDSREFTGVQISTPVKTNVVTGCGGILVRPCFFDEAFFDYDKAPPQAFFVDDIWISGHLARRNIPKYVLPFSGSFIYIPTLATLSGLALDRTENRTGENNDTMIDYFKAFWDAETPEKGQTRQERLG
jgi:hypothetical protein